MTAVVSLNLKDKKLLSALDFRARLPLSILAKEVGLSKQAVDYRINSLIKRGVIDGFFPVINTPLLGYIYCRIFVQFSNLDLEQEKKLKKYVFENKNLFWAFSLGGEFDYLLIYWVKDLSQFEEICKEFKALFGGIIERKDEQVVTNVIHLSHKCFAGKRKVERFDLRESKELVEVDVIDKEILKELCVNARNSLVEISKAIKVSPKVIAYRLKRMEEKQLIAGYRPIINYDKIGLTYYKVFFNLNFESTEEIKEFERFLINHPKVIFIVHGVSINADLDLELLAESNAEFFEFVKEVKNSFPKLVNSYNYLIYTGTIKVNYLPFY